jgi:hypothetical protein
MESIEELKQHLTTWLDGRIDEAVKTAVAEGNKDLTAYLDTHFGKVEQGINDVGTTVDGVSKDVGTVADSLTRLATSLLAIPQSIADKITQLNPFHFP